MKNDNNIRKRVFANDAFDEVKTVEEARLYYAFIVLNIATINTSLNLYLMTSGEGRIGPTTESNCLIAPPSRYSNSIWNKNYKRISIQTAGLAFGGTGLCSYRVRGVDGSCAKHLTIESYTVIYAANSNTYYY